MKPKSVNRKPKRTSISGRMPLPKAFHFQGMKIYLVQMQHLSIPVSSKKKAKSAALPPLANEMALVIEKGDAADLEVSPIGAEVAPSKGPPVPLISIAMFLGPPAEPVATVQHLAQFAKNEAAVETETETVSGSGTRILVVLVMMKGLVGEVAAVAVGETGVEIASVRRAEVGVVARTRGRLEFLGGREVRVVIEKDDVRGVAVGTKIVTGSGIGVGKADAILGGTECYVR